MCNRYRNRTLLFEVTKDGLVLRELAEGYSVEDILACTEADVIVPDEIGVMS